MSTAAESDHVRCRCGKLSFTQEEANDVVRRALVSRVLHRNARRAEQRSYPCDVNPGFWHVTSVKNSRSLTHPDGSLIIDYRSDDDMAAMYVITQVLAVGNDSHWSALLVPERAGQTRRVLARIRSEFTSQEEAQKAAMSLAKDRYSVGEIDHWEFYRTKQAYFAWKEQVAKFRATLVQRFIQAEQADLGARRRHAAEQAALTREARHAVSVAVAETAVGQRIVKLEAALQKQGQENQRSRKAAERLAVAIAAHQEATSDPTDTDAALWAVLDSVTVTHGKGEVSVAKLVSSGTWSAWPEDERDARNHQRRDDHGDH